MKAWQYLFFTLLFLSSCSTTETCEDIKNQPLPPLHVDNANQILVDCWRFENCGLDSIDLQFFCDGPVMGSLLTELSADTTATLTYGDVLDKILDFKASPRYAELRKQLEVSFGLKNKVASLKSWEDDAAFFRQIGFSDQELEDIKAFLQRNADQGWTYSELFNFYMEFKQFEEGMQQLPEQSL